MPRKKRDQSDLLVELHAALRANRELRQKVSDLRWDNRALRVQRYAEKTYAEKFAEAQRRRGAP